MIVLRLTWKEDRSFPVAIYTDHDWPMSHFRYLLRGFEIPCQGLRLAQGPPNSGWDAGARPKHTREARRFIPPFPLRLPYFSDCKRVREGERARVTN